MGTKVIFASVYHPQSNGAVEGTNGIIFGSIKKCLFDQKKGKWADELLKVIWSHNTSESRTMKFTPFRLLYGAEAMTPEELKNRSLRVTHQVEAIPSSNKDLMELNILQASENLEKYQQETTKWRDKKVVKTKHHSRGLGPKKKAKRRNLLQTPLKVGRAIPSYQKQQARVLPPV